MASQEYATPNVQSETLDANLVHSPRPEDKKKKTKNPFKWYMEKPFDRWPFLLFMASFGCTIIYLIMYQASPTMGYTIAGIGTIIICFYGWSHFRNLVALKEQVDKFVKLNAEFREENAALKGELDKLGRAQQQLDGVSGDLQDSNKKLRENLIKFEQLDENLKKMGQQNLAGLEQVRSKAKAVIDKWHDQLIVNEKAVLNKCYDQFEFKDDKGDLSKEEFEGFLNALPLEYREEFTAMGKTFEEIAGEDNMMQYEEFTGILDEWAERIAHGGGSGREFEHAADNKGGAK